MSKQYMSQPMVGSPVFGGLPVMQQSQQSTLPVYVSPYGGATYYSPGMVCTGSSSSSSSSSTYISDGRTSTHCTTHSNPDGTWTVTRSVTTNEPPPAHHGPAAGSPGLAGPPKYSEKDPMCGKKY